MAYGKLRKIVGKNIKKARLSKKLTQEEAAECSGFYYKYYQKLESGNVNLTLDSLERLSRAFKIDVRNLISD